MIWQIKPDLWCYVMFMLLDFFRLCLCHTMIADKDTLYLMAWAFNHFDKMCKAFWSNCGWGIDVGIEEIARAVLLNLRHAESIRHCFFRHKLQHVMSSSPWASATGSAFSPQAANSNQQGSLHHTSPKVSNHKPKTDPSEGVSKRSSCKAWVSLHAFDDFAESNGINVL